MMQQTSIMAYTELLPHLQKREREVYEVIEKAKVGITNTEISKYLGLPINCITGRTRQLFLKKAIKNGGKRSCLFTKKTCIIWKIR